MDKNIAEAILEIRATIEHMAIMSGVKLKPWKTALIVNVGKNELPSASMTENKTEQEQNLLQDSNKPAKTVRKKAVANSAA